MGDHVITSVRGLGEGDRQLCTGVLYFTQVRLLLKIGSTPKRNEEEKTEAKVVLSRKQMGDRMLA
jgi:hypothetical protein